MIAIDDFPSIDRTVQQLEKEEARKQGEREQLLQILLEETGCKSLDEVVKLLEELEGKEKKIGAKYSKKFQEMKEKWKDHPVLGPLISEGLSSSSAPSSRSESTPSVPSKTKPKKSTFLS